MAHDPSDDAQAWIEGQEPPPDQTNGAMPGRRRWIKRIGWIAFVIALPIILFTAGVNTQFGKRLIADQIASYAPASGLRFEVGQIEGDVFRQAILRDVSVADRQGVFLTIPRVDLDWRPLSWIFSGLDIRKFATHGGELQRRPDLAPGDPDAPILPDFDIRIDHLEIANLAIMPGVATKQVEYANLRADADIRQGLVALNLDGRFGQQDRVSARLYAQPNGNRFEIDFDYHAPADGVIAGLVGAQMGYRARLMGDGNWDDWLGYGLIERGSDRFAAFRLTNKAGAYRLIGEVYAAEVTSGILQRALGQRTGIIIDGGVEDSRFDGKVTLISTGMRIHGGGGIDLDANRFNDFDLTMRPLTPQLLGADIRLEDARLRARLDGPFRDLRMDHEIAIAQIMLGDVQLADLQQAGNARFNAGELQLPIGTNIGRVITGNGLADNRLVNGRIAGNLTYSDGAINADGLAVDFPDLAGRFSLDGRVDQGTFRIAGPAVIKRLAIDGAGLADARARVSFSFNDADRWNLTLDGDGQLRDLANPTIRQIAGDVISMDANLQLSSGQPIVLRDFAAQSAMLQLAGRGQFNDGQFAFDAQGEHENFGAFDIAGSIADGSPNLQLNLAAPLPQAGLRDVNLALARDGDLYVVDAAGQSTLGRFSGQLGIEPAAGDRPLSLDIRQFRLWKTSINGRLAMADAGVRGQLTLSGGGLMGEIDLAPDRDGQQISASITARNAVFGGQTPIELGQADISIQALVAQDQRGQNQRAQNQLRISGEVSGRGIRYGRLFLGRVAARADIADGAGKITASLSGRQGGRFTLAVDSEIAPGQIATAIRGSFAEMPISMPRRAIFRRADNGNWQISSAQIAIGEGRAQIAGQFGGAGSDLELKLAKIPLNLADLVIRDFGASGAISGTVEYRQPMGQAPIGTAKLKIDGLSRSSLLLASPASDMFIVAQLDTASATARALAKDGDETIGWLDARIAAMPADGPLFSRLERGRLQASLRYDGAAERLWRLAAIDAFDISGPINIQMQAASSIAAPRISGSLRSDNLRLRSSLSGTDIRQIKLRGQFAGARLSLRSFTGEIGDGGSISGSGFVDLAELGPGRGPRLDLRAAAKQARLIDARGLQATITGPLRILSNGAGGTIAGRVDIDNASWRLGRAAEDVSLPDIKTNEVNVPADVAPLAQGGAPWRYLVDARARNRINVDGLGLDSEWRGDIILRGTTSDPRLGGAVQVVRGTYSFAETQFELTRGRITFDENVPIDPRLDILAEANRVGIDVQVAVRGNALTPEIQFSSEPPLPEEEILSRLLFGGPVTELSPIDAVQLGAALASLRSGGGLGPVNRLRSEIGLDRLRIVGADPVLGRGAGVILGENIGRRFYVELVTDGKGYSASELEFRITSWLSLLGTVSTLGRESVVLEVSRDY